MADTIWTSKEIVGTVIATGVVSALAREAFECVKNRMRRRRERQYLSIRAAIAHEAFALECLELAALMEAAYATQQAVGKIALPPPPQLPADSDYRVLDVSIMDALFSFGNFVRKAQIDADYASSFEGNTWASAEAVKQLRAGALDLAKRLRNS